VRRDRSSVRRMVGVGERCGFRVSIGCCQLWASCLDEEAVVVVAEVAAHSCRTAVVVVAGPKHVSHQFRERLLFSMPCAYLIVSILLRRRRRLAVVVVEGWLRALVSVLLWRSGFVSTDQALHVIVYSRSAVLLLWRRVSLGRWSTIVVLRRRRRAVATATVVLLARIVGHVELR